jgi:hypothetical protein
MLHNPNQAIIRETHPTMSIASTRRRPLTERRLQRRMDFARDFPTTNLLQPAFDGGPGDLRGLDQQLNDRVRFADNAYRVALGPRDPVTMSI